MGNFIKLFIRDYIEFLVGKDCVYDFILLWNVYYINVYVILSSDWDVSMINLFVGI